MNFKLVNKSTFEEHLNTNFKFYQSDSETINLILTDVSETIKEPTISIHLTFEGSDHTILKDNTYKFDHEALGVGKLFIKPFSHQNSKIYYDVIITKFVEGFEL